MLRSNTTVTAANKVSYANRNRKDTNGRSYEDDLGASFWVARRKIVS